MIRLADLQIWFLAASVVLAATAIPIVIGRYYGLDRIWGPVRLTVLMIILYVLTVGVLAYVDFVRLDYGDGKFREMPWYSFWTLYWPMWLTAGFPSLVGVVLGTHMSMLTRPWILYAVWLPLSLFILQACIVADARLPVVLLSQGILGAGLAVVPWQLARRQLAHAT